MFNIPLLGKRAPSSILSQPLNLYIGSLEPILADSGRVQGTPRTSHQFITDIERQTTTHTHSHKSNLGIKLQTCCEATALTTVSLYR